MTFLGSLVPKLKRKMKKKGFILFNFGAKVLKNAIKAY